MKSTLQTIWQYWIVCLMQMQIKITKGKGEIIHLLRYKQIFFPINILDANNYMASLILSRLKTVDF